MGSSGYVDRGPGTVRSPGAASAMPLDPRWRLAECRRGGSERRDRRSAVGGGERSSRQAELDQVVVGIFRVDRRAPAVVDLQDVTTGGEPAILPAREVFLGRDGER